MIPSESGCLWWGRSRPSFLSAAPPHPSASSHQRTSCCPPGPHCPPGCMDYGTIGLTLESHLHVNGFCFAFVFPFFHCYCVFLIARFCFCAYYIIILSKLEWNMLQLSYCRTSCRCSNTKALISIMGLTNSRLYAVASYSQNLETPTLKFWIKNNRSLVDTRQWEDSLFFFFPDTQPIIYLALFCALLSEPAGK